MRGKRGEIEFPQKLISADRRAINQRRESRNQKAGHGVRPLTELKANGYRSSLRRRTPAKPTMPDPSRTRLPGSGVVV